MSRAARIILLLAILAVWAPSAEAAFPGASGKLAFWSDRDGNPEIYVANPDGTGATRITSNSVWDWHPAWSPDGQQIASSCLDLYLICVMNADGGGSHDIVENGEATVEQPAWSPDGENVVMTYYRRNYCPDPSEPDFCWEQADVAVVDADGTGFQDLANSVGTEEYGPAWSPDGTRIVFNVNNTLWTMNPDGTGKTSLGVNGYVADWSPDGTRLAYFKYYAGAGYEIVVANADGTDEQRLTTNTADDRLPVWSPDGTRIAFQSRLGGSDDYEIHVMNADGTNQQAITSNSAADEAPDWQPVVSAGYPRPRGASPFYVSLVPDYRQCTAPNRTHGAPLAFGSCTPPVQSSEEATMGTPDANGNPLRANAFAVMHAKAGNESTPTDEADVKIQVSVTDVRASGDLSDYLFDLTARPVLRITDRLNSPHPGGPGPGTVIDLAFQFGVPCATTPDSTAGSACATVTTADAVTSGAVVERQRAVWQLERFVVRDPAGEDFLTQGLFVP